MSQPTRTTTQGLHWFAPLVVIVMLGFAGFSPAMAADFLIDFSTDPVIGSSANVDGSDTYFFEFDPEFYQFVDGSVMEFTFTVSDFAAPGTFGHSTQIGLLPPDAFGDVAIVVEYDSPAGYDVFLALPALAGVHYTATVGTTYHARVELAAGLLNLTLTDGPTTVHTDQIAYTGPVDFNRFKLGYDYYTDGSPAPHFTWNSGTEQVDFRVDRTPGYFLEGWIDDVELTNLAPACDNLYWDFRVDPAIATMANADPSFAHYLQLPKFYTLQEGSVVSFDYFVSGFASPGSFGHSSQIGPMHAPFIRNLQLVLEYDDSALPEFFMSTDTAGSGVHYYGSTGVTYHAEFVITGGNANLTLSDNTGVVLTDSRPFVAQPFEWFQLCYDYYTQDPGGYCVWNAAEERVDFRADRSPGYFIEGWIDNLAITNACPVTFDAVVAQTVYEGEPLAFQVNATGGSGTITYFDCGLPLGAGFDTNTATFSWTPGFADAGLTSACFVATDGSTSDTLVVDIEVLDVPAGPALLTVVDVPNDQGRHVFLHWRRSQYDAPGDGVVIEGYTIWQRIDPIATLAMDALPLAAQMLDRPEKHRFDRLAFPAGEWLYRAFVPARQETDYHAIAATLADSTAAGLNLSTYFVSAVTPDVEVYFDGPLAAGYSVDNLAPDMPLNPLAQRTNSTQWPFYEVTWDASVAPDLWKYEVFRSDVVDPGPEDRVLIGEVYDTTFGIPTDVLTAGGILWVSALDDAGNSSGFHQPVSMPTGIGTGDINPTVLRFLPAAPNPALSSTRLAFSTPVEIDASITIIGVNGRKVRTLIDERVPAGLHEVSWDLRDDSGRSIPAGIYFLKLRAGNETRDQKISVIR